MRTLLVILTLTVVSRSSVVPDLFSEEHIRRVNEEATTWTAGKNFPDGTTLSQIKTLLGTRISDVPSLELNADDYSILDEDIPETFDAREQWPNCASIKRISDQSACGSCWAVSTADSMSDRICIQSEGTKQTLISAADLMSCSIVNVFEYDGCSGGYPADAWKYWVDTGIVSGGAYNSSYGCKPYPFAPCSHTKDISPYAACPPSHRGPRCVKQCSNTIDYASDLHKGRKAYAVKGVSNIQKEILTNGPVQAGFRVYDDFLLYKSGVYQKTQYAMGLGLHGVRVIGWGSENGTPYWLVANSWNQYWGENGLFKIIRGRNECIFESNIYAGIPF